MKILVVTHSERSFLEARCDLNYLEKRFPENRFDDQMNIEEGLLDIKQAIPYNGMLSLWKIHENNHSLSFLKSYSPQYKVQFATFKDEFLVIYGSDRIEILNSCLECVKKIEGPLIAGGHTLHFDEKGYAWINSAPGNMIMRVDVQDGVVVEAIEMSSIYGKGIDLKDKDIKDYFVPTDLQPTHVNCAFPYKDSVFVTLWIQGAVGVYDPERKYKEIISGFKGLHSAKISENNRLLYFTDSPAGIIWFYDLENCKFVKRFKISSRWVHDCDHIEDDIYAAGLSDENSVQILSADQMSILHKYDMGEFGKSVMFVNSCDVNKKWEDVLIPDIEYSAESKKKQHKRCSIVPAIYNPIFWRMSDYVQSQSCSDISAQDSIFIKSKEELAFEYLFVSEHFTLPDGKYKLQADISCYHGGISAGIVQKSDGNWLVQFNLDTSVRISDDKFEVKETSGDLSCVIAANNPNQKENIEISINKIRLEPLFDLALEESIAIMEDFNIRKAIERMKLHIYELKQYAISKEEEVSNLISEFNKIKPS